MLVDPFGRLIWSFLTDGLGANNGDAVAKLTTNT